MKIEGKTVLLTGGARRLGAFLAQALAREGGQLILHYHRSAEEARSLADELSHASGRVVPVEQDLSKPGGAEELFHKIEQSGLTPHFLINSASSYHRSQWSNLMLEELESSLRLNTWAPFELSRQFSRLPEAESIVNILDARMVDYDSQHLGYHLSKRLLQDLTRVLCRELAPRIRVNAVAPGIILPDRSDDPELLEKYRGATLLRRIGSPEDVAEAVLYLLGARFVTGQVLFVDGGRHMGGRFYGS